MIIWIPIITSVPPVNELLSVRLSDSRFPKGETVARYDGMFWNHPTYGRVYGITHWARTLITA